MLELECGPAGSQYNFAPLFLSAIHVYEPRKGYGGSDGGKSNAPDIFNRLDQLRSAASENSITAQLERLQGIAALMQQRDQGPMPGELLRIYAWEIEEAVKIIKKNSGARGQEAE